jgi:archaeosortase B (VPXXXP-CTERM-specific)
MAKKKRTEKKKPLPKIVEQSVPQQSENREAKAATRLGSPLLKTCILFVVLMAIMHAIVWRYSLEGKILWGSSTVKIVSHLLSMIGVENATTENTITMRYDKWLVLPECTGLNAVILFGSFVLAYASSIKAKVLAIAVGIPLILIANITRLVALGLVTENYPKYAHVFHDYVWETIFLFFIIALWTLWIRQVVSREEKLAISR